MNDLVENGGLLIKNFMKKQLKHENELEDKIKQLEIKLRSVNITNSNRLAEIFRYVLSSGSVSVNIDSINKGYTLTINNAPLSMSDAEFIEREIMRLDTIKYAKSDSNGYTEESNLNLIDTLLKTLNNLNE